MVNWHRFTPSDFEYDFESDKLAAHRVSIDEAIECFFSDYLVRRNKKYNDRYQLVGARWSRAKDYVPTQIERCDPNNHGMAIMNAKKTRRRPSEKEIDAIVEAQSANEAAWGPRVQVRKKKAASVSIPAELAARVAFLAQLHRERTAEDWLARIIKERVELEEVAFLEAKREMFARNGV